MRQTQTQRERYQREKDRINELIPKGRERQKQEKQEQLLINQK